MSQNPWGVRPVRYFDVELYAPNGTLIKYPSVTSKQHTDLQALGKRIQGSAPQVVGVAHIAAFAHGNRDYITPEVLALIDAHVAAEASAGRRLSGFLTAQINRARIG